MSSSNIAISARGLSKSYTIAHQTAKESTLAETLLKRVRSPFARHTTPKQTFWALSDLDFDIKKGDVVGILGRNGAGKSTLLKVLSRITEPTTGEVNLYGRIGSLLEVGTGFHPELTGRENIFLNGAILGMSRAEIRKQFDAIVDFAGVATFLDTPVKRYSSGMYVRLAFAVAAHLESEILVVDEVLAVGDMEFQRKCLGKMREVAKGGRTVLFVSHHLQSIAVLCTQALLLQEGRCIYAGGVTEAINRYTESLKQSQKRLDIPENRGGSGELRITSATPSKEVFTCAESKTVTLRVKRMKSFTGKYFLSCTLQDRQGTTLLHCDSRILGHWYDPCDTIEYKFTIATPWLKPGTYAISAFLCCEGGIIDRVEHLCDLEVAPLLPYEGSIGMEAMGYGLVCPDFSYTPSSL